MLNFTLLLCAVAVANPESMMLSAGVLPAVEQLFRQIPVASPAHVAAADLLVSTGQEHAARSCLIAAN
jgi:hypothetical protein